MQKRIITLTLALLLTTLLSITAFAEKNQPHQGSLTLDATAPFDGNSQDYGFTWTQSTDHGAYDTLTILKSGLTLDGNLTFATEPEDTVHLILKGDLDITPQPPEMGIATAITATSLSVQGNGHTITLGNTKLDATGHLHLEDCTVKNVYRVESDTLSLVGATLSPEIMGIDGDVTIDKNSKLTKVMQLYADGMVTIADGAKVNITWLRAKQGTTYGKSSTIPIATIGNATVFTGDVNYSWMDEPGRNHEFSFGKRGSTLTIPKGTALDLGRSYSTLDTTNGTLVVDGLLIYPENAQVDFSEFSGSGYVVMGETYYTTTQKEMVSLKGDILLTAEEVEAEGYTWRKDDDGTYTLTFDNVARIHGNIHFALSDPSIVTVSNHLILHTLKVGMNQKDKPIPFDLTITGKGDLSAYGVKSGTTPGELTVNSDIMVAHYLTVHGNATLKKNSQVSQLTVGDGHLTLGGNTTSHLLVTRNADLTIQNGATVTLGSPYTENKMPALHLVGKESAPVLTLGDKIVLLTPKGSAITSATSNGMYVTSVTVDGEEVAPDFSNIATNIVFGKKPTPSVTRPTTPTKPVEPEEPTPAPKNPFKDVDQDDYFLDPVLWAIEKKITTGTTPTTFNPYESCTRAQAVTLLWKAYGSPVVDMENPFTDVSVADYYYNAVLWAVSKSITQGMTPTTFDPSAPCTRGQIVTLLWRAAGSPTALGNIFTDVAPTDYFARATAWAVKYSITNGLTQTTFAPNSPCTRAQIITFLYRNLAK